MKRLFIGLIVLVISVVGVLAWAAMHAGSIINQYKPQLEAMLTNQLKTPVKLGEVTSSLFPNVRVVIKDFSLGEAEKGQAITLNNLALNVALLPLLSRKLEIEELTLLEPDIRVVKDATGIRIPGASGTQPRHPGASSDTSTSSSHGASQPAPISFALKRLSITEGTVVFDDQVAKKTIALRDIELGANASLTNDTCTLGDFDLNASVGDTRLSITNPKITFGLASGEALMKGTTVALDGNTMILNASWQTSPSSAAFDLIGKDLEVAAFIRVAQALGFAPDNIPVRGPLSLSLVGRYSPDALTLSKLDIAAFGGTIAAPTKLSMKDPQIISTVLDVSALEIAQAMKFISPHGDEKLFGTVTRLNGSAEGALGEKFMATLDGGFQFQITNGGVRGVNIAAKALEKADSIPFIQGALSKYIPASFQGALREPDTRFSSLTGAVALAGGRFKLQQLNLVSDLYTITSAGTIGFDSSVDLNATISFSKEFSQALAVRAKDLNKLLTPEGTLVFPLIIQGTVPSVLVVPDFNELLRRAGEGVLREKATEALGRALSGSKGKEIGKILGF